MSEGRVTLRIDIDDELNDRLTKLCTHHGQKSFIIRNAIKREVRLLEAKKGKEGEEDNSAT